MTRAAPVLLLAAVALLLVACETAGKAGGDDEHAADRTARILSVSAPSPLYPGSWIEVQCDRGGLPAEFVFWPADESFTNMTTVREHDGRVGFRFEVSVDDPLYPNLSEGPNLFRLEAVFPSGERTAVVDWEANLGRALAPTVDFVTEAGFYGAAVVVHGAGFPLFGEGTLRADLDGSFTPDDGGDAFATQATATMSLVEEGARDRASFRVPTALGEGRPGRFEGQVAVKLTPWLGEPTTVRALPLTLEIGAPALFGATPAAVALGEEIRLEHGGLVSDDVAWSLVVLEGRFEGAGLGQRPVHDVDLIPRIDGDGTATVHFAAAVFEDALVAESFGAAQGRFEGTLTARVAGPDTVTESTPLDVVIELLGVRQAVALTYLPGYYESLYRYGLQAASLELASRIEERVAAIYDGLGVRISTGMPEGVDPQHVTRVEIGGPDPNGLGLFGFDNTPGKDIGNLRLSDVIGGENAETQQDGYPGYGGVFIESYLYWKGEPDFDAVFAPVMAEPVGITELLAPGDDARAAQVEAAVSALANVIAETIAHELGHAMGLANPDFPSGAFHNAGDGPGCLMDVGEDRPFGERAGLPGYEPTHFCQGHDAYLSEVLSAGP